MSGKRFWIVLFPDISHPVGGVLHLHRFANALKNIKQEVYLVQDDPLFRPSWFASSLKTISADSWEFGRHLDPSHDIIVMPETYVQRINDFNPAIPKIIFNQNTSYTFGLPFPDALKVYRVETIAHHYSRSDVIFVLCVSRYDRDFLVRALRVPFERVLILPNCIEMPNFNSSAIQSKLITYMPRKNARDAYIVKSLISLQPQFTGWKFISIKNMTHDKVIRSLSSSILFLSFGYPEGFGLPVAEAIASGNAVIGYSGLGGREIFDLAAPFRTAFEIQYGDFLGFVLAFNSFAASVASEPQVVNQYLELSANNIARHYSAELISNSVASLLRQITSE